MPWIKTEAGEGGSEKVFAFVEAEAGGGEFDELAQQGWIRGFGKVEAGFALHVRFEFGGDAIAKRGVPIKRHEVEADVGAAGNHGAKEQWAAFVAWRARLQVVAPAGVGGNVQILFVRQKSTL